MSNGGYTDPRTGQFQWGKVIQEMLRNWMAMKKTGREKEQWEKEYGLSERRTEAYEKQAQAAETRAGREPRATGQEQKHKLIDGMVERGVLTFEQGERLKTGAPQPFSEELEQAGQLADVRRAPEIPKPISPTSKATAAESLRRYDIKMEEDARKREEVTLKTKLTRDTTYMNKTITRFSKERERMFSALGKLDKKDAREQQANIGHIDQAISMLDSINAQLRTGQPLQPEAYDKAADILANMKNIRQGLYNFETGEITPTVNEKAIPKDLRKSIMVNPQTGERMVWMNGKWHKVIKKK